MTPTVERLVKAPGFVVWVRKGWREVPVGLLVSDHVLARVGSIAVWRDR